MTLILKGNVGAVNLTMTPDATPLVAGPGSDTFSYTGADQTWTRPAGITSVTVKIWGAGGGGSDWADNNGGAGGYTTGTINVTNHATLTIKVGGGGTSPAAIGLNGAGWQDGGNARNMSTLRYAGGGGGRSAIRNAANDTEIICAGAGGGAGALEDGYRGNDNIQAAVGTSGTSFQGGDAAGGTDGGGGGGGYIGGDAGNLNSSGSGGEGYIGHGDVSGGLITFGGTKSDVAFNTGDSDYSAPISEGATNGTAVGGNGFIVISWT